MAKIILTGDRPTGRLHVGHYVGSLRRRVELQNSGEFDKIFIMIAMLSTFCLPYVDAVKIRTRIYPKNSYTPLFVISICKA